MLSTAVDWAYAGHVIAAAFLASLVEVVEAFTIVLAVSTIRGWKPAVLGAGSGLVVLLVLVAAFGPLLSKIPLHVFQLTVGVLLLLFGMRWLRKAILRAAGIIPLHDENAAFAEETAHLRRQDEDAAVRLGWIAGLAAFKAVVLEGLEVVFIVLAIGAQRGCCFLRASARSQRVSLFSQSALSFTARCRVCRKTRSNSLSA
jgi:uncharacterized membrane protein